MSDDALDLEFGFRLDKSRLLDNDERLVYGWMSVTVDKGEPVIDRVGDIILTENLKAVVHKYMDESRATATMHRRDPTGAPVRTGRIQDSIVITGEVAKALGMDGQREGWYVSIKVEDDETWDRVKRGELRAFSIGARGSRVEV